MKSDNSALLTEVAVYYAAKFNEHGDSPRGLDWNGEDSQTLRFEQLCKIIKPSHPFSIYGLGCGYGALYKFLTSKYNGIFYKVVDVSENMIVAAEHRYNIKSNARFAIASYPDQEADYGVASGVFNVRLDRSDEEWKSYFHDTLDSLNKPSRIGFSFNCLTTYSDADKMRGYLYYPDPRVVFALCKRRYSKNVALLNDYGLYEFTVLERKQP